MSSVPVKFKVNLEFDVEITPISVPDAQTLEVLMAVTPAKAKKTGELRAAMQAKGMSDAEIEKAFATAKAKPQGKGPNYQMLLHPEYETSVAAQQVLQAEILNDPELSAAFVREMVRETTRGRVEALLGDKYGECDLAAVLQRAMSKLSEKDRALLKADQVSLVHDETELLDGSVSVRFAGVVVSKR